MKPIIETATKDTALDELRHLAGSMFAAMERSGVPMAVIAPRLRGNPIIFINAAFSHHTGFTEEEVLGQNFRLLEGPESDPETIDKIEAAFLGGMQIDTEIIHYRRDGTPFWNSLSITPVLDGLGKPAFFLSSLIDISAAREITATTIALKNRQRELQEANERLRITLAISGAVAAWEWHIPEAMIVGDAGFATLYGLNEKAAAAGVTPHVFFSKVHPEDRMRIRLAVGGMLRGAEVFSKEYRFILSNGSVRWVHARGRCQYDDLERPLRFSGVLVDITEQKRIEERLRIAQIAGGIGTFEYIDGFGTMSVSEQFCNLLGLHPAHDLPVHTVNALVHPDDTPVIDLAVSQKEGDVSHSEFRITRPNDGAVRWLARRGEYLLDAETASLRFSGVIYDITHTKQTEEALRALNETLEMRVEERTRERDRIWRVSRDLFILCDNNRICKNANPAWQNELGYHLDEVQGQPLSQFIHPDDRSSLNVTISRLAEGHTTDDFDARILLKNGGDRTISWTFISEKGAFYASGRDITYRNELEEQLRQSQKMEAIGHLTGGIAHDFNNLLTGILGSLDLIRRRLSEGRLDKVDQFMDGAIASANRAAALTQRLLAFSRSQSLDIRAMNANKLVASMEDLFQRTLGEQITLTCILAPDLWLGLSDINQLESALLNLVINARDATGENGKLTIETVNVTLHAQVSGKRDDYSPGDYVGIYVSDNGSGMSSEVIKRAFDPFFTTKPLGHGTGLGLSMVYGFVKQSGGHVRILSEANQGTTIQLYIPRYLGEEIVEEKTNGTPLLPNAEGETILVVEDEPTVRLLVLEALQDLNYKTIEANDSQSAILQLRSSQRIDLMISDVGLPGMNGRQLVETAREIRPGLKVIFMTGYAQNALVRSDFLLEDTDMIQKPFDMRVLAMKIRAALGFRSGKSDI